jgi:acyl-CoA thioester hydrolase
MGDLTPADFPFLTFDKIRYADTDRQGHVNNAVYATFLETGRERLRSEPTLGDSETAPSI